MTEKVRQSQITQTAFASPQALAAADLTTMNDLTVVTVGVVNDQYLYLVAPSPTPAADGLNVIAPAAPAGALAIRQYIRNQLAQYVTTWFIDPVSGDDRNSGMTLGAPLKTLVEWGNRMRWNDVSSNVVVTVAAGTLTDLGPLDLHIGTGILVTIQGTVSSSVASTFSALTPTASGSNTRGTATDGAGSFSRGQRLRTTSGATSGAITYTQGGTTGTVAQVTGWSRFTSNAPPGNVIATGVNPSPGDSYVVDTLQTTFQGRMDLRVKGAGRFLWKDMNFTSDPSSGFASFQYWRPQSDPSTVSGVQFVGCSFDSNCFAGFVNATCHVDQSIFKSSMTVGLNSTLGMADCVFQSTLNVFGSATLQMQNAITLDGGRVLQTDAGFIEANGAQVQAGATASGGVAWEVDPGCASYQHNNARLWGPTSGYAFGIRTYSMAAFQYDILPSLTGSTVDARIAGTDKTWATLPFANTSNLSEVVALP